MLGSGIVVPSEISRKEGFPSYANMAFSSEDLALMLVSGSISVFAAAGTGDVLVI